MREKNKKILGIVLVGMLVGTMAVTIIMPSVNAQTWPDSSDWILMFDDGAGDASPGDVDIRDFYYYTNTTHVFFRIETAADYDSTDSTLGVVLNDRSLTTYNNELAIAHYRDGVIDKAKGYYWDGNSWEQEMAPAADHIKINEGGFHGVNLSFDRIEMDDHFGGQFSTDLSDVDVIAYTTDKNINAFDNTGYGASWNDENYPGTWTDDDTEIYSIPEFSTLLIPIVGMIALFAIFRKYKKK